MTNLCVTQGRSLRNCGTNKTAAGNVWFLEDYLQGGLCTEWGGGDLRGGGGRNYTRKSLPWDYALGKGDYPWDFVVFKSRLLSFARPHKNELFKVLELRFVDCCSSLNSKCLALIFDQNYLSISLYRIFFKVILVLEVLKK